MDNKLISAQNVTDEQRKEQAEAAEKAAKAGVVNRLFMKVGQKVGIVEWTKLEPRFESNINKLITYHKIVFGIVDLLELQIQTDLVILNAGKIEHPKDENPWELIGGWMHYLATQHFEGQQSQILHRYSYACGRATLIRKMRSYTSTESERLNDGYALVKALLNGMDDARHTMKSASTTRELKERGENYRKMISAFNERASEIQGSIDEVTSVVKLHQMEFLKFAREMMTLHNTIENTINETRLRVLQNKEKE